MKWHFLLQIKAICVEWVEITQAFLLWKLCLIRQPFNLSDCTIPHLGSQDETNSRKFKRWIKIAISFCQKKILLWITLDEFKFANRKSGLPAFNFGQHLFSIFALYIDLKSTLLPRRNHIQSIGRFEPSKITPKIGAHNSLPFGDCFLSCFISCFRIDLTFTNKTKEQTARLTFDCFINEHFIFQQKKKELEQV